MHPLTHRFLAILFSLGLVSLHAQIKEPKIKFGKVSDEEMAMTTYAADPAAPAVILFDKGTVTHRYNETQGFILEFERHKRIKILKKEGYDLADFLIFYYEGQKVLDLKAVAYNLENGKIVETKLNSDNVFEEKITSNNLLKKGVIPGVREGSVIEFKYSILDEGVGLPVGEWVFQHPYAPTVWSEFESSVPAQIEYRKMAQGWTPFLLAKEEVKNGTLNINYIERDETKLSNVSTPRNLRVDYNQNYMHYIQENVPALKPEPFVASVQDYLSKINFDVQAIYRTTLSPNGTGYRLVNGAPVAYNRTWEGFGRTLMQDYYDDLLSSSKFTGSEAEKAAAGKTTPLEKATAVYEFIGKNYQNNQNDYFWRSQNLESLTKSRKGTPTDLNLLFINMLRRVKVDAYPVLISTKSNGRLLSYRVSSRGLDRVVTAIVVDSTVILTDASSFPNPIGFLPPEDLNGEGLLLLSAEDVQWVPLQNKMVDRRAIVADIKLKTEGGLSGKITFSDNGHEAVESRKFLSTKSQDELVKARFKTLLEDGQASDLNIEAPADWNNTTLKGSFNLQSNGFVTVSGNKMYISPMLGFGLKENPFKNPDRKFGIDFSYPSGNTYVFTFAIPPGYTLEEAPKSAKIVLDESQLNFDYLLDRSNPELIKLTVRQNTRVTYVAAEKYFDLQQYYTSMFAKMAEQIVLTK